MKKTPMIGVLVFVLVLSMIVPHSGLFSVEAQSSFGVKEGDRVFVDDAEVYISSEPHTLMADGYVYLNVTSKGYGGEVDLCFGFDSKQAYPTRLEVYDPQVEVEERTLDVGVYLGRPEYRVGYNFTAEEDSLVYDGWVWVYYDNEFISSGNQTSGEGSRGVSDWTKVLSEKFDFGDLDAKMFHWRTEKTVYWRDILGESSFDEEVFSFQEMKTWYLGRVVLEQDKEYYFRMWLTMVPTLNSQMREFFVGFKPHGQSFEQAVANGRFRCLDPWYSSTWCYRKSHVITAASGAGTNYPVRINVHSGYGSDSGADVYCNGKCKADFGDIRFTNSAGGLLDYWLEGVSGGVGTFWVEVSDDLSSTSRTIYICYGNSGAPSTSNGAATFGFFDDFSSSPNGWTLSNAVISGGMLDLANVGYPNVAHAYKSRPGYDNYRFRFAEKTATTNMGWQVYARERGTPPDNDPLIFAYDYYYNPIFRVRFTSEGGVATSPYLSPARDNNWHKIELTKHSSSYTLRWDSLTATCTDGTVETGSYVGFCHLWSNTAHLYIDWVFLSKFVSPEPGHGSWGQEEGRTAVVLWGTLWYDPESGEEPEERNKSGNVTQWIYQLFYDQSCYSYCQNYWGSATTDRGVYGNVSYCDQNFDYVTVFYKGHTWNGTDILNDGHNHYSVFSYGDSSPRIIDLYVFQNMTGGFKHRFVFLWTCMLANEIGEITGADHSRGMPASWMGTINLSGDGYTETNDYSDQCFISFMNISMPFRNGTGYGGNQYAQFIYQFYNYSLNYGYSVKEALDAASSFACGHGFEYSNLYNGYNMTAPQDPNQPWRMSKMRVLGDGDHQIPG